MRVATDVGGTFTDLIYYAVDHANGRSGPVRFTKVSTTPPIFEAGVFDALKKASISTSEMDFFVHGSTVVINTITERKGAKTALLTTNGFRDVLEIGRANRPDLFNLQFRKPEPLIERRLRCEIVERTNFDGSIAQEPDLSVIPGIVQKLKDEGVDAIAISFLHAYRNPTNERRVAESIRKCWPECAVVASHEISREWREYERTSTVVASAYVEAVSRNYMQALTNRLSLSGFAGTPMMMQSNGGMVPVEEAIGNPITMIESGPASGIFAASVVGNITGFRNLIALDIGGTTAKCALIENGHYNVVTEYYVERDRRNPGLPIQTPVTEIVEIGNGGGSIASVDTGGKLHVGPKSAGAKPGPAAYGLGGTSLTTTDANLILGRIDPTQFVGGEVEPDWQAVSAAAQPLCSVLGCSEQELARGVLRVATANMANALRLVSINKGHDPRDFSLIAFGGGGALHAVELAEELQIPRVIIPVNSAVFSAWGMLLSDIRRDDVRTLPMCFDLQAPGRILQAFAEMERGSRSDEHEAVSFEYLLDLRYTGQEHTVKMAVTKEALSPDNISEIVERFSQLHEKSYTFRLDADVEVVNCHLVTRVTVPKPSIPRRQSFGYDISHALLGSRLIDFDKKGVHDSRIFDAQKIDPSGIVVGPAAIQDPATTILIPPAYQAEMDDFGNFHITRETA
ncbi:5-oxoprolinase [Sphingobium sp. TA15]|uniref:N-methylhydantoinase A n=1 Tax=Sphingobium indicum (strain DSM 16413 / CCM 7287 / MTCC 6362 / UT26 / NBRC 101211 / UT26S) TaxID=452662 RepID=D4Z0T7_SPHIU|nr:hydantoinase/oxoprolinase family protein [Sphingobium indicum]BAI96219.1 N-methylhydantoinase A [Sphingobium indicum UT26S]BDD65519.1 5-oxoprolinase [Sphingobium sp. TA15]